MKIMVVGSHPDDIELGIGGSVAKWVNEGYDVTMVDLTSGEPTPFGDPVTRAKESAKAASILGVTKRINLGLPNRELTDNLESRRKVAEIYRQVRPEIVFIQGTIDAHPDHLAAASLAWKARFDAKLTKTDMAGDPWWPKKVIRYLASHLPHVVNPTFILDVSNTFEKKIEVVRAYESQFAKAKREDWMIDKLTVIARSFGGLIGVKYGEAFMSEEVLGLLSIRDIIRK